MVCPKPTAQRFVRECEILSTLNHRSIADVLDFGITDDYLYLALEYFPCGSLRDRLKNPVSEADAVNYARQIGEALQVLHAAHVVHRDLKPSNLMLTDDNRRDPDRFRLGLHAVAARRHVAVRPLHGHSLLCVPGANR